MRLLARQPQSVDAVERDIDGKALGLEARPSAGDESFLVVDHQDPHQAPTVVEPILTRSA